VRPTLGIAVRLTLSNGTTNDVLVGCVHIADSDKAPYEVFELRAMFGCSSGYKSIRRAALCISE
jgi:hypothetical protein